MTTQTTENEVKNLSTLIQCLDRLIERAQSEYHAALVEPAQKALEIAISGLSAFAATNIQLEAALASLGAGRRDEVVTHIKLAQKVQAAWFGGGTP